MGRDCKFDGLNKATSSHLSASHEKVCEGQWRSEALKCVSTSEVVPVDKSDKNATLKNTEGFSTTFENTSLEEKTKYSTLLSCLQHSISNSSDTPEAEEKDCQMQIHTQVSADTSLSSEHTSQYAVENIFGEDNREESNGEASKAQSCSSEFRDNLCDIPIVNVLQSIELSEAGKHKNQRRNILNPVLPPSEDKNGYSNGILAYTNSYCGCKHVTKSDEMVQCKTLEFNGAMRRMSGIKSNFIVHPRDDSTKPKWQKILYERQPFDDNYVDIEQFLVNLRTNEHLKTYEYTEVVKNTFAITQQISIVILFACAFSMLLDQKVNHYTILYVDLAVFIMTFVMYLQLQAMKSEYTSTQDYAPIHLSPIFQASSPSREKKDTSVGMHHNDLSRSSPRSNNVFNGLIHRRMKPKRGLAANTSHNGSPSFHNENELMEPRFLYIESAFGFFRKTIGVGTLMVLLTPILSTLTASYSNDTIVALSIFSMSLHVLTADYSYLNAYTTRFSPNLSVNAASFGVIMMASRIPNPLDSGALIAFGSFCFSLSPIVRHFLRRTSFTAHVALTFLLFGIDTGCLLTIPVLVILYVTCILMISFVIPWWFVALHSSMKNQINGPWDEAKPTNSAAAAEWANYGLLS